MTVLTREGALLDALARIASYQPDPEGIAKAAIYAATSLVSHSEFGFVKPDTSDAVFFYEQDFYVLSNFSAFAVEIFSRRFPTAEHAYHYAKFLGVDTAGAAAARQAIMAATSAHVDLPNALGALRGAAITDAALLACWSIFFLGVVVHAIARWSAMIRVWAFGLGSLLVIATVAHLW